MPKFKIERSIDINAPAARVRSAIQDYGQWSVWSPWLCMEPSATVICSGTAATTGHAYSWEGDMVGSGRMELVAIDGTTDNMDLTFLKPFKSTAKVAFETVALDADNTRVTWHMDSGLPFFLFFMVGTMKAMIGMDYDRGLKMLKEYVETGVVTSTTEIVGVVDAPAITYAGVSADSALPNISESMGQTFPQLMKMTYQHLGNAWSTANSYLRHKKLKRNKQIHPFELYQNDPQNVAASELITEVYLPVNS